MWEIGFETNVAQAYLTGCEMGRDGGSIFLGGCLRFPAGLKGGAVNSGAVAASVEAAATATEDESVLALASPEGQDSCCCSCCCCWKWPKTSKMSGCFLMYSTNDLVTGTVI